MKLIKFIKENKIITLALAIVILSFVFLALPGQYAHFEVSKIGLKTTYNYYLSGYEWMFATVKHIGSSKAIGTPVASGIAALVMLGLIFIGLLFSKKSSFVSLLVVLALITVAILFFTSSSASAVPYKNVYELSENGEFSNMSWVPYVLGSLTMATGLLMGYRTFLTMKDEAKHPTQQKGPTYSYLHK